MFIFVKVFNIRKFLQFPKPSPRMDCVIRLNFLEMLSRHGVAEEYLIGSTDFENAVDHFQFWALRVMQ
jgi:hypothetical protein